MKNKAFIIALAAAFALSGCGKNAADNIQSNTQEDISEVTTNYTNPNSGASDTSIEEADVEAASDTSFDNISDMWANLPPINRIDDKYRTTYEIFVYSFYDSNGDGIGDLQGVIDKLDYINDGDDTTDTDLGCDQIWLMPISPSPTYHKYDVTDYMDIDPEYGTLQDFDNLVKACHDRGVNVIIDTVLNHTSSEHPWFKEATGYLKSNPDLESIYDANGNPDEKLLAECPYLYYYNFAKENQTGFEKVNGTNWYYEARFWSGMPDLNLDNEAVFGEITEIIKFWTDRGVDGFRLDAVTSYYTDNNEKNIEFMTKLNTMVKEANPDAYIVAEAWTAQSVYGSYYASGIDSFFDFDFSGSEGLVATVARGKKAPSLWAKAMEDEEELYASVNPDYVNAPFYTNHDMARSAGYFVGKGSQNMIKMAGALNLLMGGNAFVYYGEELGMKGSGKDENKRAPMQWTSPESNNVDNRGMCDGPKDMEKFDMPYPSLDEQVNDPYSIYNYYKKAIRMRNTYPVIARGKTLVLDELSEDRLGAFVKYMSSESGDSAATVDSVSLGTEDDTYGPTALLFLINNGSETQTVDLSKWNGTGAAPELVYELEAGEETASLAGTTLTIPSYGIAVIR